MWQISDEEDTSRRIHFVLSLHRPFLHAIDLFARVQTRLYCWALVRKGATLVVMADNLLSVEHFKVVLTLHFIGWRQQRILLRIHCR